MASPNWLVVIAASEYHPAVQQAGAPMVPAPPGPDDELAPAGLGLRPDPGSRLLAGGTVLVGGSPVRVLRLTPSGARQVAGWWSGTPVPDNARARALARRLLDTGIAHPVLSRQRRPGLGSR